MSKQQMTNTRIGIIEDDRLLNQALETALQNAGYDTVCVHTRKEALVRIGEKVALLLVDIGLPDGNGISLYQELQEKRKIPAIFLTARDEERDMLAAFEKGADDYVVKPFSMKVLLKRVEAVLKRNGKEELLSFRELDGQFVVDNTVSVTINRLRKKIEPDAKQPVYIKNVFGLGYRMGEK